MMSDKIQQHFTCEICIEPALLSQKFSHHKNCVHNICYMCIGSHIQSKIDDNIYTIKCPELNCGKALIPMECRSIIPSLLFVKWCDCLCRSSVSAYTSCYCAYRDCSELIINECDEATTKCVCPACKRLFCFVCSVPWHAGFRCSEATQERDENDVQFGLLLEKMKWTRCPKCGQSIERLGGCQYVTCRCRAVYCHVCGSEKCRIIHRSPNLLWVFLLISLFCSMILVSILWR